MPKPVHVTEFSDAVDRFHRVLTGISLDCECRTTLDGALDRFFAFERRRQLRDGLQLARRQRDMIASQLRFLAELDEITEREADRTVFEEMAQLFDEISASAAMSARAIRETRLMLITGV
jgi:hypothetical protein